MLTGIAFEAMVEALLEVPPFQLQSVVILHRFREEGDTPSPSEQADAIREQITYSRACEQLAGSVRRLTSMPLLLPEFSEAFPL